MNAPVSKTGSGLVSLVGSNPTLSAFIDHAPSGTSRRLRRAVPAGAWLFVVGATKIAGHAARCDVNGSIGVMCVWFRAATRVPLEKRRRPPVRAGVAMPVD